jgi:hypothetical protein
MGENAAFYPRKSILAKKYLAIPASYVSSFSEQKEGLPQSFKYWQYHFMN